MVTDLQKEKLCVNRIVGQKKEAIEARGDIIVPDIKPDILSAIEANGNICIYKKEILEGKIKIEGTVNTYIIYLADDENGETRSLSTDIDFSEVINFDGCNSSMILDENLVVRNIECKVLNGRKISVNINIDVDIKLYSNSDIDIITNLENMDDVQMLRNSFQINSIVGMGTNKVSTKENCKILEGDNLAEILSVELSFINKDVKISYNKLLAKADLYVKIMYLTENNNINVIENNLPLMGFIDVQNINENNICDVKYKMKNIIIKPNNSDENSIYVEAEADILGFVYETKNIELLEDLYSPTRNLEFTSKEIQTISNKQNLRAECNVRERINLKELSNNKIYNVEVRPIITSPNILNGKVVYDGELELIFMFEANAPGKINVQKQTVQFNYTMEINGVDNKTEIETQLEILNKEFIVLSDGGIDCRVDLVFNVSSAKMININIIDELEESNENPSNIYSMVIYFVKSGDTLWKIAKKFRSTVQEVVDVNEIENPNKIDVGMQLFIPKYV